MERRSYQTREGKGNGQSLEAFTVQTTRANGVRCRGGKVKKKRKKIGWRRSFAHGHSTMDTFLMEKEKHIAGGRTS